MMMLREVVPKKTKINNDCKIVVLMDCMADIPCSAGRRASEVIMNAEKVKNMPASKPDPIADAKVK